MRSLLLFLALVLFASPALAQQPPSTQQLPPNDNTTALFRGLFHFHGIQPETEIITQRGNYDYSNLIVVVCGDPLSQNVKNICRSTLSNGGAVLIAADTEMSVGGFFPEAGDVKITGSRVSFDRPELIDNGLSSRPLALAMPDGFTPFNGIERLATNDPSYVLAVRPPRGIALKPVAAFPPGATVTSPLGQPQRGVGVLALPFALATTDNGPLRCMVIADQDVFSNRMIYTSGREQNPTDNLKFANNTVQWLKGNGRTKCLFIDIDRQPAKTFKDFEFSSIPIGPQIPPPPIPNIDPFDHELQQKVTDALNQVADQAQQNDVANKGILSIFRGSKASAVAALAVILLFLTYVIFRWRTMVNWYRRLFRPIPRDSAMLGPDVPVGSLGHRRLELLRSADYGPVVRPVVRELFQDRGLPGEYTGDKLPPLDIDVRRPQFLKESIQTLWAAVRSPAAIGYGKWKQLEPLLAAVRAAAEDDRWRFVAPSPRDDAS